MRGTATAMILAVTLSVPLTSRGDEGGLPLPDAPVRLLIPDADAFDAALGGGFGRAARGDLDPDDPLVAAWRQSKIGSKLEAQWETLAGDLPWTWTEIRRLQPRSVGVALLQVGALEAVVIVDTALATLPLDLPTGTEKHHGGATYALVATGAGDHGAASSRRLGLAWARHQGLLFLATSERALLKALDEQAAGRGVSAVLPGLASLDLDLDALQNDPYFLREFPFGTGPDRGRIHAALRLEEGHLVEVRRGGGPPGGPPGLVFVDPTALASGWEPGDEGLWTALRTGLLEPIPHPLPRPVPARRPLPPATTAWTDPYLVDFTRPLADADAPWEEGDVAEWRALLSERPTQGWGWRVSPGGERAIALRWPVERQEELARLCRATLERRAGPVFVDDAGAVSVLRVGPDLEALALRRDGDVVWIATSAALLQAPPALEPGDNVVRWGRVDLDAVRGQAGAWARAEGPAAPERLRPFSDRILGLLGWMPAVSSISVERRRTDDGWTERVVLRIRVTALASARLGIAPRPSRRRGQPGAGGEPGAAGLAPRGRHRARPSRRPRRPAARRLPDQAVRRPGLGPGPSGRPPPRSSSAPGTRGAGCPPVTARSASLGPSPSRATPTSGPWRRPRPPGRSPRPSPTSACSARRPSPWRERSGASPRQGAVSARPETVLRAYAALVREPWSSGDAVRRAIVAGLRDAAREGTARAFAGRGVYAKTGTVPALDGRALSTSGWALAVEDSGDARLALLLHGTGREAADALAANPGGVAAGPDAGGVPLRPPRPRQPVRGPATATGRGAQRRSLAGADVAGLRRAGRHPGPGSRATGSTTAAGS